MWLWFHSGWIIILPLAMMALCILMSVLARRQVFSGCGMCCGYKHSESDSRRERRPQSDSRNSREYLGKRPENLGGSPNRCAPRTRGQKVALQ